MPLSAKPLAALLTSTSEQKPELTAQRAGKRAGLRRAQKCVRQQGRVTMLAVHETSSTQGEYAIVRQAFVSEGTRCGDDLVQVRRWSVSQSRTCPRICPRTHEIPTGRRQRQVDPWDSLAS